MMEFALKINAIFNGSELTSGLRSAQNAMNAFKNSTQTAISLDGNMGAAMKYAQSCEEAARVTAQMNSALNRDGKFTRKLEEAQKLSNAIKQVQEFKSADERAKMTYTRLKEVAVERQKVRERYAVERVNVERLRSELVKLTQLKKQASRGEKTQFTAQIKSARTELKVAEQTLKNIGRELEQATKRGIKIGGDFKSQTAALSELRAGLSAAGVNANQLAAAERILQARLDSTTASLNRQASAAEKMNMSARMATVQERTSNISDKYSNFQNSLQTAEMVMSPFTSAAQNAMSYEYELSNVKALTQLKDIRAGNIEKVSAEMTAMDKVFRHLGATTEYTSTQMAQSAGYFAMAGWDAHRIMEVMPAFASLATATGTSGVELARLADVFSDDMTAIGLQAGRMMQLKSGEKVEESQYFADVFAYALTNANLNRESLHEGVKYFGPVAKQMDLSVSEMIATAMWTANAGIKGSQMGTAFRAGLIRMVAPTKGAEGALSELGLTMSDAQKQYHEAQAAIAEADIHGDTFIEKIRGMAEYLQTLDKEGRADFINKVFGKNAYSAWAKILENPEAVAAIAEQAAIMDSTQVMGYAEDTAAIKRESTLIQVEQLKSAWDAVENQMGTALLSSITQLAQTLAPLLLQFSEWISKNQELIKYLAAAAAMISAVIVAAAGLQLVSAAWGMVTASAGLAQATMLSALATLRGLSLASVASALVGKLGAAFMALSRAAVFFCATPIGIAISALVFLGAAIYQNWDKVGPLFRKIGRTIYNAFKSAFPMVSALIDKVSDFFGLDLTGGAGKNSRAQYTLNGNSSEYKATSGAAIRRHRTDATREEISAKVEQYKSEEAQKAAMRSERAVTRLTSEAVLRHRSDATKLEIQTQLNRYKAQEVASKDYRQKSALAMPLQRARATSTEVQNPQAAISEVERAAQFTPTQLNGAIETVSVQTQLNELGSTAAINAGSLRQSTTNQSAVTSAMSSNAAATISNAVAVNANAVSMNTHAVAVNSASNAANANAVSTQNMGDSAAGTSGTLQNLSTTSGSASTSITNLGDAAMNAISKFMSMASNAASSVISSVGNFLGISNNYSGGIYRGGAFISWINEKGPEAIIPLDGSARAVDLWRETGAALGVYSGGFSYESAEKKPSPLKIASASKRLKASNAGQKLQKNSAPIQEVVSKINSVSERVTLPIQEVVSKINSVSERVTSPIQEVVGKINSVSERVTSPIQEVVSKINSVSERVTLPIQEVVGKINSVSERVTSPIQDIFNLDILKPVPTFPEAATFPEMANPTAQTSFQPTINVTINVRAQNAEEFKSAIPEITRSFESEFEEYVNEWQRRSLNW